MLVTGIQHPVTSSLYLATPISHLATNRMVKRELTLFFTALMFYTRIPCPKWVGHSSGQLNEATRYFPLIGWIVGGSMAGTIYLALHLLPLSVSVLLGLGVSILMTGAFHEDG